MEKLVKIVNKMLAGQKGCVISSLDGINFDENGITTIPEDVAKQVVELPNFSFYKEDEDIISEKEDSSSSEEVTEEESTEDNYDEMTVKELRIECRDRGLQYKKSDAPTKVVLIDQLREDDS